MDVFHSAADWTCNSVSLCAAPICSHPTAVKSREETRRAGKHREVRTKRGWPRGEPAANRTNKKDAFGSPGVLMRLAAECV